MKKIFTIIFTLISFNAAFSQTPTYILTADNVHYNQSRDKLEWDIYIKHTNPMEELYLIQL